MAVATEATAGWGQLTASTLSTPHTREAPGGPHARASSAPSAARASSAQLLIAIGSIVVSTGLRSGLGV